MIYDTQSAQIPQKQDECNICNHENNVPFRFSPQWLCGNSCTLGHMMYGSSCAVHHAPKYIMCLSA